jgi:photosystem II stability/assembly factor-like uncharacterized protein
VDKGESWFQVSNTIPNGLMCDLVIAGWDQDILFGSTRGDGIYISNNKGGIWERWEPWNTLLPDIALNDYHIWLNPYEDGIVYVSFRDHSSSWHLLRSEDKGITWSDTSQDCTAGMAFDSNDQRVEYCADGSNLHITKDGGLRWDTIKEFPDNHLYSLALSPSNPSSIYLGSTGVIHSQDGGISWETEENGLGAVKYEFLVNYAYPDTLFLLEEYQDLKGHIFKSTDEGSKWDDFNFDIDYQHLYFDPYGGIYLSMDTELMKFDSTTGNFDKIASLDSSSSIRFVFDPFKEGVIFGTGDATYIFRSGDFGKGWEQSAVEAAGNGRLFFSAGDTEFIFFSQEDEAYFSPDLGNTWERCGGMGATIPDSGTAAAIDTRSGDHDHYRLYLATRGEGLMVSSDSCKSWTSTLQAPFGSPISNSVVIDPSIPDTVYAGTDAGVYMSNDKGTHWNKLCDGLPGCGVVYSLLVREDGKIFAATPFGLFKLENK